MRLSAPAIREANSQERAALIGYLPAGFPTVGKSIAACQELVAGGVDVIELGLPYSDPGMDGPVIQRATESALEAGIRTNDVLHCVEKVAGNGAAVVVMTYYNPVLRWGIRQFAADLASAGGAGLIIPDLPPEEGATWEAAAQEFGLETIYLAAPVSPAHRLEKIVAHTTGWVYAASTMGITGTRNAVDTAARDLVDRLRAQGADLVNVGLGVSTEQQVAEIAQYANGVIVGSALLKPLFNPDFSAGLQELGLLVAQLRSGVAQKLPEVSK